MSRCSSAASGLAHRHIESMCLPSQWKTLSQCMLVWRGSKLDCSCHSSGKPKTNIFDCHWEMSMHLSRHGHLSGWQAAKQKPPLSMRQILHCNGKS